MYLKQYFSVMDLDTDVLSVFKKLNNQTISVLQNTY